MNVRDPLTSRVRLQEGEVHLWWRRVGEAEPAGAARVWISDEERRRSERFRREKDARAFVARRCFLRSVLASYLECSPGELVFGAGPFGKPALTGIGAGLSFNLSRSAAWILVGVTRGREIGVDVERMAAHLNYEEEISRLAERVLTPSEREHLARLPEAERGAAFVRAWARKEALLKALGLGLSREPNTVEVGLDPLGPLEARALDASFFPRSQGALLLDLVAPAGFAASVVAEGRDWNLLLCSRAA